MPFSMPGASPFKTHAGHQYSVPPKPLHEIASLSAMPRCKCSQYRPVLLRFAPCLTNKSIDFICKGFGGAEY
jgi:hypothetical protein